MKLPSWMLQPQTMKEWALYWAERGYPVVPGHERQPNGACTCTKMARCERTGKHPRTEHGITDATVDPGQIERWWNKWPTANILGAMTGRLALDVDLGKGGAWADVDGLPVTRKHLSGRGDGGGHLIFTLTAAQRAAGFKSNNTGRWAPGIDVKTGSGNYLVLPPSLHGSTGGAYSIAQEGEVTLPDEALERLNRSDDERVAEGSAAVGEGGKVRSLLASLLANPATEGDRNVWLASVCGHYAKMVKARDAYDQMVADANAKLAKPMAKAEVKKTADSIWKAEQGNHPGREIARAVSEQTGWLAAGDHDLLCLAWAGPKDNPTQAPAQWADFDLKVKGVIVDPASSRIAYDLILLRSRDRSEIEVVVDAALFGDAKRVGTWLAGWGCSIAQPERVVHRTPPAHVKLLRYLQSQDAPSTQMAPALGWDWAAKGFLTHEGVITASGLQPFAAVRPDPALRLGNSAPYAYGFSRDVAEARRVLKLLLTFQDEQVCSVFGAWWAANLLKPFFMQRVSMFPAMAIQAASGAGKTNGYFAKMIEASGNRRGEGHYTIASLRNALAANTCGAVWVDDLDEPRKVHELTRSATSNGTITKVGEDRTNLVEYTLVGSMILTGEALALSGQKAMAERFVSLKVDSPVGRMSQIKGREDRPQWDDVLDLAELYPDRDGGLTVLSGHYVALALQQVGAVGQALRRGDPGDGSGRVGEKSAVLRVGAMLLDAMLDDAGSWKAGTGVHAQRVNEWLAVDANTGRSFEGDNKLTMEILPWALRAHNMPTTPLAAAGGRGAFIEVDIDEDLLDGGESAVVWFSPKRLAEVWYEYQHGRVDTRTETAESFTEQARQLAGPSPSGETRGETALSRALARKQWRTSKESSGNKQYYWRLTGQVAAAVLRRARGDA